MNNWRYVILAVFLSISSFAYAKGIEDTGDLEIDDTYDYAAHDPFEKLNRGIFKVNKGIDIVVLKPVSRSYKAIIPQFARDRVHNFLQNLTEPVNFINGLLQLNPQKATTAISRFMINSSFGLAGIHDVAGEAGLKYIDGGFSDTLMHYGSGTGPYIVLPIVGSSSGRDTIGLLVDTASDLFIYIVKPVVSYSRTGASIIDKRTSLLKATDLIEQSSVDEYATYRSLYFQKNPK